MNLNKTYQRSRGDRFIGRYYIGTVEDVDDPFYMGRCRVRVFGIFGYKDSSKNEIPTNHLPYAYPINPAMFGTEGGGSISIPKIGQLVRVRFDGDIYHPLYDSLEEHDTGMLQEAQNDYDGFRCLMWDTDARLGVYYTNGSGLVISNKDSIINIGNDSSIIISHADGSAVIELRGDNIDVISNSDISISSNNQILQNSNYVHINGSSTDVGNQPIYNAALYQPLMLLIKQMAAIIDQKMPLSPGVTSGAVQSMEAAIKSDSIRLSK